MILECIESGICNLKFAICNSVCDIIRSLLSNQEAVLLLITERGIPARF